MTEIRYDASGLVEAFVTCPRVAVPLPGQYLLASDLDEPSTVLGTPLFTSQLSRKGFWAAPSVPAGWKPGTNLSLVGPLGHGFDLRSDIQRLGLVALGDTIARLMPLVSQITHSHAGVTLFTDLPLPQVPASLEVYPLDSLPEALDWPDFLVFDLPLDRLPDLRSLIGLPEGAWLPCPAQALVYTPMPCAGMAQCGACALPTFKGWKLACKDGPVFNLQQLRW